MRNKTDKVFLLLFEFSLNRYIADNDKDSFAFISGIIHVFRRDIEYSHRAIGLLPLKLICLKELIFFNHCFQFALHALFVPKGIVQIIQQYSFNRFLWYFKRLIE